MTNEEIISAEENENLVAPETQVLVVRERKDLNVNLDEQTGQSFTSIKGDSREEKTKLFKAKSNPDKRLADCINQKIYAKDLFMEVIELHNKETGEVEQAPRIVLIDKDGVSYSSVSFGIYHALKSLCGIYGMPTWEEPIPIIVKQRQVGENKKALTLDVDFN